VPEPYETASHAVPCEKTITTSIIMSVCIKTDTAKYRTAGFEHTLFFEMHELPQALLNAFVSPHFFPAQSSRFARFVWA
jgi:hypothetical protein